MRNFDLKKLMLAALLASFTCVCTMIIQIPNGIGGYFNLGDCIVLLSGWGLGPIYGAISAGIGSMLADVFSSYLVYAPATFVIKALMAVVAFYTLRKGVLSTVVSCICAELVMIAGYFAFEWVLYGFGTATLSAIPNALQGACGIVCAVILKEFLERKRLWKF